MSLSKQHVVFMGNPGAGKSTLLNSLVGKAVFRSGLSAGSGLTQSVQWHDYLGVRYGDTPGLADVVQKQQVVGELKKALQQGGLYRLVFVLTLEAGHVKDDDVTTIHTVLDAINCPKFSYGIVINKVSEKLMEKYSWDESMRQGIMRTLRRNHRSTNKIFLYPFDSKLDDADNAVAAIRQDFQDFLGTLPAKLLISEQVNDIEAEDFEALKQEYERKKQRLREENERIQAALERVKMEFLAELPFNILKTALGIVLRLL